MSQSSNLTLNKCNSLFKSLERVRLICGDRKTTYIFLTLSFSFYPKNDLDVLSNMPLIFFNKFLFVFNRSVCLDDIKIFRYIK